MREKLRFLGLDVHAETIAVAGFSLALIRQSFMEISFHVLCKYLRRLLCHGTSGFPNFSKQIMSYVPSQLIRAVSLPPRITRMMPTTPVKAITAVRKTFTHSDLLKK